VLFMVARLARELHIDAEQALRAADRKFRRRFQAMERLIREEGRPAEAYTPQEWIALWRKVKTVV
jgi:tetrapyrrole methylase family protein / MazG family protein